MDKPKILLQLDTDAYASVFDRVVAVDAGVDQLFAYGSVKPENVQALVHGAIFTRGPKDLKRTAIFVGGSDVAAGEAVLAAVQKHIIPAYGLTVSLMLDSNGANTTAAAAVRAAARHADLPDATVLVLGGTGPVGQRVARLMLREGAHVRIGSRQLDRAESVAQTLRSRMPGKKVEAVSVATSTDGPVALKGCKIVVACGAAGALLLPKKHRENADALKVMIDLNAVPPAGIEGVGVADKGKTVDGVIAYGAIGVGDTKMKVHKAAIAQLFERNDLILDAEEIYGLAKAMP
jgi:methylenetetrahydrofolate/methylenetetrahydromethanopterin dehydrogenase (NADP+)